MKSFTKEELAKFDGIDGKPAYVAYLGKVYDVSKMHEAEQGDHFGHPLGVDLTDAMDDAPHDDNLLFLFPVVGEYKD